jgi:two-component system OmpR family sensor kinase
VRFGPPRRGALAPLLTLAAALLVFGIGAFLTAKWIARPLDRLTSAARALGRGDLQARAALDRNDELGELGGAFDEMAGRIRELLLAEKELLANVSHELRTPLARIRVALEIAAEGDAEAARAGLVEIALDLSEIEALIDDILTATRMELATGKTETAGFALHRKPTAPASIAERAAQRFRVRYPARTLLLESGPDLPDIEADAGLLRRALDNLLENAHKYSPDAAQPIALRLSRREQAVCFEVEDRGLGVPEEDLPRLFTAFFRGERSRSRGTGGVGLGLTLAKRIVEAHGGTIAVESERGTGTLVRVVLPVGELEPAV